MEEKHDSHVQRLRENYRTLAVKYTKLQEEHTRVKMDKDILTRLVVGKMSENKKLKKEIFNLKKLID